MPTAMKVCLVAADVWPWLATAILIFLAGMFIGRRLP